MPAEVPEPQARAPQRARRARCSPGPATRAGALPGLAHAKAVALGDAYDRVMKEAVKERHGRGVLGKKAAPLLEAEVAGDPERAPLVGGRHEAKQQLRAGGIQGGEADLVDLWGYPHKSTYAELAVMPNYLRAAARSPAEGASAGQRRGLDRHNRAPPLS